MAETGLPPSGGRKASRWLVVVLTALALGVLGVIGYKGQTSKPWWEGATDKEFWDYLELLIVPAVLAIGAFWLNRVQERERQAQAAHWERAREAEAEQREREREATEEARRVRELEVEERRAQDAALQAYLDQMGRLLLDEDKQLGKSKEGDAVRTLARAWTITALTRLGFDGVRKRSLVQFLYEANLITKDNIVIDLREAFLNFVNLNDANLTGVNLSRASLTKAMMNGTKLGQADLSDTMMFGANLLGAKLRGADMSRAVLMSGNTDSIPLPRASVTRPPPSFDSPGPKNANLELADLREVDFTDAYVSEEQLLSAASLAGATMPNGQKYEDWLKSKGQEENKKSDGSS